MSDTNISFALAAKSDQLNAMDIIGSDLVIRIRDVKVRKADQPVWLYFDGDNNRPWKPSKGMLRILAAAWGDDASNWIGKHAQLFHEPSVRYAGKEVGGIRIRALSDIPANGLVLALAINRQQREPFVVKQLTVEQGEYPDDKFDAALPRMTEMMQAGIMTLQQVIARCQQTGTLTAEQLARLEAAAPIEIDDTETNPDDEDF